MREFNLEEAKKGHPVCTKDGKDVRIICFDAKFGGGFTIIALVKTAAISEEIISRYNEFGVNVNSSYPQGYNLVMKTFKKSGYVNLHKMIPTSDDLTPMGGIYPTEDDAKANISESFKETYCTTAKIEWEE